MMAISISSTTPLKFSFSYKSTNVPKFHYIGFSLFSKHREFAINSVNSSEINEALEPYQRDSKSQRIHLLNLPLISNKHEWTLRGLLGSMILLSIPFFWKKFKDEAEKRSKSEEMEWNKMSKGRNVRIEIREGSVRPIGNGWPRKFSTEIGNICRTYPLATLLEWNQVQDSYLDKIHKIIMEKFDIDLHLPHVRLAVDLYIKGKFKGFMYKLYKHFSEFGEDEARRNPFDGISQDDWNRICDHFMTERFQRRRRKQFAYKNSQGSLVTAHSQNVLDSNASKPFAYEDIRYGVDIKPGHKYIEIEEHQQRIKEVEIDALEAEKRAEELEEMLELQRRKIEELEQQIRKFVSTEINTDEGISYTL